MRRIQIFIEHDIVIRHFLHSNTFSELEKHFDVQYVFPIYEKRVKTDIDSLRLKSVVKIPVNAERLGKLRYLAKIQAMHTARRSRLYRFVSENKKVYFDFRTYFNMWVRSLPVIFPLYKSKIISHAGPYPEMGKVVDDFAPHLIIHPSVLEGVFISDLALLTKDKNIPFVVLMNSWDNPSTKAMIIKPPDWLVVWGEQTKQHSVDFLGMKPERVKIFGAAQFEVYRQPPSETRDEFCRSFGVSPDKKLILYAGSSKSVNEMKHLKLLDKAVEKGELKNCHIIFRPHPWRTPAENEPDFYDILWKNVSMDITMKDSYNSPKHQVKGKVNLTSYMDTHNILNAIDMLISNMSTILIEAALHGKPILCMVSDDDINCSAHMKGAMNSLYIKELLEKLEVPRCRNFGDLSSLCSRLLKLASVQSFADTQREKARFFVDQGDEPYPVQLCRFIQEIIPG